jgi:hypothetical protein
MTAVAMKETAHAVKERPILFSGTLVRALLDDRKTQTRRIMKMVGTAAEKIGEATAKGARFERYDRGDGTDHGHFRIVTSSDVAFNAWCPYGVPGERLWVREAWAVDDSLDLVRPSDLLFSGRRPVRIHYCADGPKPAGFGKTRAPIHMPRLASRLTLEITEVRVQRLQEICEEDARAEGVHIRHPPPDGKGWPQSNREVFTRLWASINGADSWVANPWVWCISFRRIP